MMKKHTLRSLFRLLALLTLVLAACTGTPAPDASAPDATDAPLGTSGALVPEGTATAPIATESTITEQPVSDQATIESIAVSPTPAGPSQLQVIVQGSLPDACSYIDRAEQVVEGATIRLDLILARLPNARCALQPTPFLQAFPIETSALAAGAYTLQVGGVTQALEIGAAIPATPAQPGGEETVQAQFEGIRFRFPKSLSGGYSTLAQPAVLPSAEVPAWNVVPNHIEFTLEPFALPQAHAFQPQIRIYPVAEYETISPEAAQQIADLRTLLATQPADPAFIPALPIFNAQQVLRAQVKYLNFQNGSGVRFVSQYAQGIMPVSNDYLIYSYQGLTADGLFYVSVVLPVTVPFLPTTGDPNLPFPAGAVPFGADFPAYVAQVSAQLNAAAPTDFTPNLDTLDAVVQSLQVTAGQ